MSTDPKPGFPLRGWTLLIPPLTLLGLLCVFRTWNVVWGDGVTMSPLFDGLYGSTLTFGDLWESYQGHRLLFPRLLELLLGWLTHWNVNVEIGFIYLTLLGDFALLCSLLRDLRPAISARAGFVLAGLCSLSVFSTTQVENWTNGFMMNLALSVTCVLAGVVLLAKFGASFRTLAVCILAGTVASYSFGNGITYWLALAPLLYVKLRGDPRWLTKSLLWVGAAGAVIFFYFHKLGGGSGSMTLGQCAFNIVRMPGTFFTYLFSCAGAGVFFLNGAKANLPAGTRLLVASGAPVCGFVGLTILVFVTWRLLRRGGQTLSLMAPWLSLGLYGILSVGVTSVARYTIMPLESAIASRYIAFSQFVWLALFVFLALLAPRMGRGWRWSLGGVLALCYVVSFANGLRRTRATSAQLWQVRTELLGQPTVETYRTIKIDRDPAEVAADVEIMRRHRLALFHDASVPLEKSSTAP